MIDAALLTRANEAFDRVRDLDCKAAANARAFRSFLEDLNRRNTSLVRDPHKTAIEIVRAAILRSAVGTILACLDPPDRRDNRASVGQILVMLEEPGVFAVWQPNATPALQKVREDYDALLKTDLFDRCRRLRDADIAHLLKLDTPTVEYPDIYALNDQAERIVVELCRFVNIAPECIAKRTYFDQHAKLFWDAHLGALSDVAAA